MRLSGTPGSKKIRAAKNRVQKVTCHFRPCQYLFRGGWDDLDLGNELPK